MPSPKKLDPLIIEGARIILRNFAGVEKMYNAKGERNFCVALDPALAEQMIVDEWNVKYLKPDVDTGELRPIIRVKIRLDKGRPPRVVMITSKGRTTLTEDLFPMLDYADISYVDLRINPWRMDEESKYTAYLGSIFVTIREDALDLKYADYDEIGPSAVLNPEEVPF